MSLKSVGLAALIMLVSLPAFGRTGVEQFVEAAASYNLSSATLWFEPDGEGLYRETAGMEMAAMVTLHLKHESKEGMRVFIPVYVTIEQSGAQTGSYREVSDMTIRRLGGKPIDALFGDYTGVIQTAGIVTVGASAAYNFETGALITDVYSSSGFDLSLLKITIKRRDHYRYYGRDIYLPIRVLYSESSTPRTSWQVGSEMNWQEFEELFTIPEGRL